MKTMTKMIMMILIIATTTMKLMMMMNNVSHFVRNTSVGFMGVWQWAVRKINVNIDRVLKSGQIV